jgi:hypothetical protein
MSELLVDLSALARVGNWAEYHRRIRTSRGGKPKREDLTLPPYEHSSRDPWPEGQKVPTGAARLAKLGEAAGWTVRVQYARGWRWGVGANQVRIHTVAVCLRHLATGRFAVARWEAGVDAAKLAWKSDMAKVWTLGELPCEVGVTALSAWVTGPYPPR